MKKQHRNETTLAAARAYFEQPSMTLNEWDELVVSREDGAEPDRFGIIDSTPKKVAVYDSRDQKVFTIIFHE